jgi:hypothetical protein
MGMATRTGTPASSQRCSPALPRLFSMGGTRTRAVSAISWAMTGDGWKRPGPRTAMAAHSGRWAPGGAGAGHTAGAMGLRPVRAGSGAGKGVHLAAGMGLRTAGAVLYCGARPNDHEARRLQLVLGERLHALCWPAKARIGSGSRIG